MIFTKPTNEKNKDKIPIISLQKKPVGPEWIASAWIKSYWDEQKRVQARLDSKADLPKIQSPDHLSGVLLPTWVGTCSELWNSREPLSELSQRSLNSGDFHQNLHILNLDQAAHPPSESSQVFVTEKHWSNLSPVTPCKYPDTKAIGSFSSWKCVQVTFHWPSLPNIPSWRTGSFSDNDI